MKRSTIARALLALTATLVFAGMGAASALASGAPIVKTTAASFVSETEATLNGVVNPNGESTKFYFEYGTTTSYGSKTAEGTRTGTTEYSVLRVAEGLTAGTTYHFRVVATNSSGTSYGADEVLKTLAKPEFVPKSGKLTELEYLGNGETESYWETPYEKRFGCSGVHIRGQVTGASTVVGKINFTGCHIPAFNECRSSKGKAEEIASEELEGTLVYLSRSAKKLGIVFQPKSTTYLIKYACTAPYNNTEVRGSIIFPIGPVNKMGYSFDVPQLNQSRGKQEITEYENGQGAMVHTGLEEDWFGETPFESLAWEISPIWGDTNREMEIKG
jgi:hypothetical protein